MITGYTNNNINFRGYDARPLKAVVMRQAQGFDLSKAAYEMREIGAKCGFDVILESRVNKAKVNANTSVLQKIKNFFKNETEYLRPWIQDVMYFTKDKMLINKDEYINHTALCKELNILREEIPSRKFISGGNLFLLKDGDTEKILVGEWEKFKKAAKLFPEREIIQLPQADFHIDLFVRPLKDNVIIAADDNLTIAMLQSGQQKLEKILEQGADNKIHDTYKKLCDVIKNMQQARKKGGFADTNEVISTLEDKGYNVIRTPGRIYDKPRRNNPGDIFIHSLNFINAVAATDKNGDIVYISNKTDLPEKLGLTAELAKKTGLDFEAVFKKSVEDYIKPENIYFIKGGSGENPKISDNIAQILKDSHGGIHCLCTEIPE